MYFTVLRNNALILTEQIVMMNSLQVTSIDQKNDGSLEAKNGKLHHPPLSSMVEGLDSLPQPFIGGIEACNARDNRLIQLIHPALYDKFYLQLQGIQVTF